MSNHFTPKGFILVPMLTRMQVEHRVFNALRLNDFNNEAALASLEEDYDFGLSEAVNNINKRVDDNGVCTFCEMEYDGDPVLLEPCSHLAVDLQVTTQAIARLKFQVLFAERLRSATPAVYLAELYTWAASTGDWIAALVGLEDAPSSRDLNADIQALAEMFGVDAEDIQFIDEDDEEDE